MSPHASLPSTHHTEQTVEMGKKGEGLGGKMKNPIANWSTKAKKEQEQNATQKPFTKHGHNVSTEHAQLRV